MELSNKKACAGTCVLHKSSDCQIMISWYATLTHNNLVAAAAEIFMCLSMLSARWCVGATHISIIAICSWKFDPNLEQTIRINVFELLQLAISRHISISMLWLFKFWSHNKRGYTPAVKFACLFYWPRACQNTKASLSIQDLWWLSF